MEIKITGTAKEVTAFSSHLVKQSPCEMPFTADGIDAFNLVTEVCPHCEIEQTVCWDVERDGYAIYCPNCGKRIMLCSMCDRSRGCDWNEKSGCRMGKHNIGRHMS